MKLIDQQLAADYDPKPVAFTPKGGCPLKRKVKVHVYLLVSGSVAFTPKGGCPLKPCCHRELHMFQTNNVAFTPKGGCPLKLWLTVFI